MYSFAGIFSNKTGVGAWINCYSNSTKKRTAGGLPWSFLCFPDPAKTSFNLMVFLCEIVWMFCKERHEKKRLPRRETLKIECSLVTRKEPFGSSDIPLGFVILQMVETSPTKSIHFCQFKRKNNKKKKKYRWESHF